MAYESSESSNSRDCVNVVVTHGKKPLDGTASNYGTPYWQWTAGSWVSNVGSGANDKFSSLKDVP